MVVVTPEEIADLAHLRRARDLIDREYAQPLDVPAEVRNDVASACFRWVTVGAPGQDVDIVLSQPHGGRSQAEGDALLSLVTQGSLSQPWGARDCAFRDPSGNLVRIAQA